jgi:hypothetical protein
MYRAGSARKRDLLTLPGRAVTSPEVGREIEVMMNDAHAGKAKRLEAPRVGGFVVAFLVLLLVWVAPAAAGDEERASGGPDVLVEGSALGLLEDQIIARDDEIELFRGRNIVEGASIVTVQDLEGVVSGNVIEGQITTGDVSIAPDAFSHFDGISSVIVNSGNNVSIQSSMVVNVTVSE